MEPVYAVVYCDGREGEVFGEQVFENILTGLETPAFGGATVWAGYVFVGWSPLVEEMVTDNRTYTALWAEDVNGNGIDDATEPRYTVTYIDGAGETVFAPQSAEVLVGMPTPEFVGVLNRAYYTFKSWNEEVTPTVEKDVTYEAIWASDINNNGIDDETEEHYTVEFDDGYGEVIYSHKVLTGMPTPAVDDPTKESHVFNGWDKPVETYVTEDITYTATWFSDYNSNGIDDELEPVYTIIYDDGCNGEAFGVLTNIDVLTGLPTTEFDGSTDRTGYVFVGWTPHIEDIVTDNRTYTAIWAEDANGNGIDDALEPKYTVTFVDGAEETVFSAQSYEILVDMPTPEFVGVLNRAYYTFKSWNIDLSDNVTGDVVYRAIWAEDINNNTIDDAVEPHYTVAYSDGMDNLIYVKEILANEKTPVIDDPKKDGYIFDGWSITVEEFVTGDVMYSAKWIAVEPEKQPSFFENVPLLIITGTGIVSLLLIVLIIVARKRKRY